MKSFYITFISILLILFSSTGCSQKNNIPAEIIISKQYPGQIMQVDSIDIRDGSNGQLRTYNDSEQIKSFLEAIAAIQLLPQQNQAGAVGTLYSVKLYEGDEVKLSFSNQEIEGIYYQPNEQLNHAVTSFMEVKE